MQQDVINLCLDQALYTFRAANEALRGFVGECGGWSLLPKDFTLNVKPMTVLERQIEQAVVDGDLCQTQDLCDQYKKRFSGYLDGWRKLSRRAA